MICIFCQENKAPSDEHIIPENVGGSTIIRSVCIECNNQLGTSVDSELNKQRHIYDAFSKLDKTNRPNLEFHFSESYYEDDEGNKIKLPKTSKKSEIVPTQIDTDFFIIDRNDNQFVSAQINKIVKREGISKEIATKKITEYMNFSKNSKPGDVYTDDIFGIKVITQQANTGRITVMSGRTPHRFLSKACVEFAHALGISDKLKNLDLLREHALHGNRLQDIHAFQEISEGRGAMPFHLIQFTEDQFHVHFFLKYAVSIEILWVNRPELIFLAEDLLTRDLRICIPGKENLEITKYVLNLRALENQLYQIE